MTEPVGLSIGSHRWTVSSDDPRYLAMLAERYRLVPTAPHESPHIVVHIGAGRPGGRQLPSDQLLVTKTANGFQLTTDPIMVDLAIDDDLFRAKFVIMDGSMREDLLGFHLWLLVNRMMLIMDRMLVHAAAVEIDGQTVMLCGESGAGKSTLTVALGLAGGTVLAEDWLLVNNSSAPTTVSGVSPVMRLNIDSAHQLLDGRLDHAVRSTDGKDKQVFEASTLFASAPGIDRVPDRVFLLTVGEQVELTPASALDLTRHLAENTKWTLRFSDRHDYSSFFGLVSDLASSAPAYHLRRSEAFGDLPRLADVVRTCRETT